MNVAATKGSIVSYHGSSRLPLFSILLLLIGAFSLACSDGNGGQAASFTINVLSPPTAGVTISTLRVTVEVEAQALTSVRITDGRGESGVGVLNGPRFLVFNAGLVPGNNTITVVGTRADGSSASKVLNLSVAVPQDDGPSVVVSPRYLSSAPAPATLSMTTAIAAQEMLVDIDGDGLIEFEGSFNPVFAVTYPNLGDFVPIVTIRTASNVLLSTFPEDTAGISVLSSSVPVSQVIQAPPGSLPFRKLAQNQVSHTIGALTATAVHEFTTQGALVRTIPLSTATNAVGLSFDQYSNLYVVDQSQHRVFRYLAASNYAPDPALGQGGGFGSFGTGPGQFNSPTDIAVDSFAPNPTIHVLDAGNSRIQRFLVDGALVSPIIDGNGSALGPLVQPTSLLVMGSITVAEPSVGRIRGLTSIGTDSFVLTMSSFGNLSSPAHVGASPHGELLVIEASASRVQLIDSGGQTVRVFDGFVQQPISAVLTTTVTGDKLYVIYSGGNTIEVRDVPQEGASQDVATTVQSYIAALLVNNIAGARALFDTDGEQAFESAVNQPLWESYRAAAAAATLVTVESNASGVAFVAIADPLTMQVFTRLLLRRNPVTKAWQLTAP